MTFKKLAKISSNGLIGLLRNITDGVRLGDMLPFGGAMYSITALAYYDNDRNAGVTLRKVDAAIK